MSERIVVDPVTRIEGHLRVEVNLDETGKISDAYSSGTSVRGLELILKDRDPRDAWAFAQRICGVCTLVHGLASVRSVEDALGWEIPPNAHLIRNLMSAAQYVHDHVMHFYHLHALDWVDVVSALDADPKATSELAQSISTYSKSSPGYFADAQTRVKGLVESGQLGIFANAYWGHEGYRLPPEANLMAVAHYLEALAWQREVVRLHAIFGGKNPHPNFLVGGCASPISTDPSASTGGFDGTSVNVTTLQQVRDVIATMREFVERVYLPDTLAVASFYKDWFRRGEGVGNFMTYGDFPLDSSGDRSSWMVPAGVVTNRDLGSFQPIDLNDPEQVTENVARAWYSYSDGDDIGLHPYDGQTKFAYDGPQPPYTHLDVESNYSWLKSPRWRGQPMEVGPLARMVTWLATGNERATELATGALRQLDLPVEAIYSTMGRTAARALETQMFVEQMDGWLDALFANIAAGDLSVHNAKMWEPRTWPKLAKGVGTVEAPRGALGHWIVIRDGKIDNYQAVVPTTWNAGPRDADGGISAYEAALMDNHELAERDKPLEIIRTLHSFDPCLACAVHVAGDDDTQGLDISIK
ncbi:MAG: nickel-dependent hydrogenase large subunit [Rhodobacteraceae bacterium]|nr:nickel-dependent hydrogenase large subunit [Alphaproteobacteria bacterium]NNK67436.1 nickel-dependent hydrogenase large subunit [Paracoccaceae bacterium]